MPRTKIAILLLNYRQPRLTLSCQEKIQQSDIPRGTRFIIIDNSSEHSHNIFKKNLPEKTTLINARGNLGFAAGNNLGIKKALREGASHIMIVNPDVTIPKEFFSPLLKQLSKDETLGLIAPAHKHKAHLTLGGELNKPTGIARHQTVRKAHQQPTLHDFVSFACVIIKAEVFKKAGLLNEKYFMYFEDVDFCLKAKRHNYNTACDSSTNISHAVSSSFQNHKQKLKYLIPSHFKFINTWIPWPQRVLAYLYQFFAYTHILIS